MRGIRPRRRWWLYVPLAIVLFGGLALVAGLFILRAIYDGKAAAYSLGEVEKMESASIVLDRNGVLLGNIYIQNRETIPLEKIAYSIQQAVVAAEDARFYTHRGADYIRIVGAALRNYRAGRIAQGGSTITQQLARNSFGLRERSFERKLVEIFLAARIEKVYSKKKILELYLNRIYFGNGFYGVESAARGYFGKPAADLSNSESALLAGLIKSPNKLSPWENRRTSLRERDYVLGRMRELGMITQAQYQAALEEEVAVKNRRRTLGKSPSYAMEAIRQKVISEVGFEGATSEGFKVHTTIDASLQKRAEQLLEERLRAIENRPGFTHPTLAAFESEFEAYRKEVAGLASNEETPPTPVPRYLQGALLAIDNTTGAIISVVGGRNFQHSEFNRALRARRPPGTAFKPLVYAAAFANGLFPGTLFEDSAIDNRLVMIGGTTGILGEWGAERYDNRYEGMLPAKFALIKGKNAATVRVGNAIGLTAVIELAKKAGISTPLREFSASFLGSSEATLAEMVTAFSMFPNEGWRPESLHIVTRIEAKDGDVVFKQVPKRVPVIDARAAYQVHSALEESLQWGTAAKAISKYGLKQMVAGGKTGTAYDFTDLCFIGYTSEITCGVWTGFDKPQTIFRGAFSSDITLPVWVDFMNAATEEFPPHPLIQPPGLRRVEVDLKSGKLVTEESRATLGTDPGRLTYFELATEQQVPFGSDQARGMAAAQPPTPQGQWPKAALAVDVSTISPIPIQAPIVLGEDPYGAVTLAKFQEQSSDAPVGAGAPPAEEEGEVRRAIPVRPMDDPREKPVRLGADEPPPLYF